MWSKRMKQGEKNMWLGQSWHRGSIFHNKHTGSKLEIIFLWDPDG
jgi:hypothetical protein